MVGLGEYRCRRGVLLERIRALEGRRHGAARHRIQLTGWEELDGAAWLVQTDLVEYMIMGYNREYVRPFCDVCTVGWCASLAPPCVFTFQYMSHAHDESPVAGDGARTYGVVQDDFCLSELVAV